MFTIIWCSGFEWLYTIINQAIYTGVWIDILYMLHSVDVSDNGKLNLTSYSYVKAGYMKWIDKCQESKENTIQFIKRVLPEQ